jgi:hypothetical protein
MLQQERLWLVEDSELRQELAEITVSPTAVDPGYTVETHGPDDRVLSGLRSQASSIV